jgi:hypothetical protein
MPQRAEAWQVINWQINAITTKIQMKKSAGAQCRIGQGLYAQTRTRAGNTQRDAYYGMETDLQANQKI